MHLVGDDGLSTVPALRTTYSNGQSNQAYGDLDQVTSQHTRRYKLLTMQHTHREDSERYVPGAL